MRTTLRPTAKRCTQVFCAPVAWHVPAEERTVPRPVMRIVSARVGAVVNAAVTDWPAFIVSVQTLARPVHAPPQVANVAPDAGVAVSVTVELTVRFVLQAVPPFPQLIPGPLIVPRPLTVTESGTVVADPPENEAVTDLAADIDSVQVVPVPLQAPPQPVNVAPDPGLAKRVTLEFSATFALHAAAPLPQEIPPPETEPGPLTETVSGTVEPVPPENVALTLFEAFIRMVHVDEVPPQAPLQPRKVAPAAGSAFSVTVLLFANFAAQTFPLLPQLIAPLSPLTFPLPETVTASWASGENVAETPLPESISTVQVVAAPPQAPLQPENVSPTAGVAVSVTVSPIGNFAEHTFPFAPQLIAPPSPLTLPLPDTDTVSWTTGVKVAVTDFAVSMRTEHVGAVPVQAPSQLVKAYPSAGVAVSTTVELTA